MKVPFLHHAQVTFVAIGLIVVSTVALGFFSYRYMVGHKNMLETSLVQNNQKTALNCRDLIEKTIVDNDLTLLEMIDVDEPAKWPSMVESVKKADLNVDQVYFFRPGKELPIYPPYSDEIRNQWGALRASFKIRELNLDNMVLNQPHHLHKERPDNYFFASYTLRETRKGTRILVCFQMNFDRIIALLDQHLRELQDRFYVSVVDYENNGVYGPPISRSSNYFFETRFPNTLYKWFLQIVPRQYSELELGVKNQRRTNMMLIILSTSLTFFSLAIIYIAWRRDVQLRQLKEDFISNVSHELKTPLSLIRMFSEILLMGRVKSEDKKQEYFQIIHNESDRMGRLINNLLDFAKVARGIEYKHFEKTNIAQLVTKALEAYRYEIQKDGFQVYLETAPGIPDSFADPNAITMAFFNLLDNSVKYSGSQKEIDVRVGQEDGFISLSVSDKGIGIPASEQDRIFDQFYRGNDPRIRRIRGSGIGLAIIKHVAEMHAGHVSVQSEPGKGSTFTLKIPIRETPEDHDSRSEIKSRS